MLLGQPQQAQAAAITHFRLRLLIEAPPHRLARVQADALRPLDQLRGRPSRVRLMRLGQVLGHRRGRLRLVQPLI